MYYIPNSHNEDDTEIDFSYLNSIQAMDTATELLETNNINNADNKIISKKDYLQVNNKFKQNFDEIISSCYFADNLHYLKIHFH